MCSLRKAHLLEEFRVGTRWLGRSPHRWRLTKQSLVQLRLRLFKLPFLRMLFRRLEARGFVAQILFHSQPIPIVLHDEKQVGDALQVFSSLIYSGRLA